MEINLYYNTVGLIYIQSLGFGEAAVTLQCTSVLGDAFKDFVFKNTKHYVPRDAYLNAF